MYKMYGRSLTSI